MTVWWGCPQRGAVPNKGMELTASSVRSRLRQQLTPGVRLLQGMSVGGLVWSWNPECNGVECRQM